MKKVFQKFVVLLIIWGSLSLVSWAEESTFNPNTGTIMPVTSIKDVSQCEVLMRYVNADREKAENTIRDGKPPFAYNYFGNKVAAEYDILGCAITTGAVAVWMLPYYIRYVLEFVIGLAGLIAVGAIMYGGFLYLFAGVSESKDTGKHAISNGIIGLIVSLTAWVTVNIIISLVS